MYSFDNKNKLTKEWLCWPQSWKPVSRISLLLSFSWWRKNLNPCANANWNLQIFRTFFPLLLLLFRDSTILVLVNENSKKDSVLYKTFFKFCPKLYWKASKYAQVFKRFVQEFVCSQEQNKMFLILLEMFFLHRRLWRNPVKVRFSGRYVKLKNPVGLKIRHPTSFLCCLFIGGHKTSKKN